MLKEKLSELKDAVREWMATLSINEVVVNRELSAIFANIEQMIITTEEEYARSHS